MFRTFFIVATSLLLTIGPISGASNEKSIRQAIFGVKVNVQSG